MLNELEPLDYPPIGACNRAPGTSILALELPFGSRIRVNVLFGLI